MRLVLQVGILRKKSDAAVSVRFSRDLLAPSVLLNYSLECNSSNPDMDIHA